MKNFHRRLAALLSAVLLATVLPTGALARSRRRFRKPMRSRSAPVRSIVQKRPETQNARPAGADGAAPEACAAANAADTQTEETVPVQEDTIVQRSVQDDVAYVDETGAIQTQDSVTEVTAEDTTWESGWYVAQGDVIIDHRVAVNGTVVLILADDCTLTVNGGINVSTGNSFTVYAQEAGTGFADGYRRQQTSRHWWCRAARRRNDHHPWGQYHGTRWFYRCRYRRRQ